ncbi:MAG: THUMP domain-containing protein [Porphyromonas sp.]|nr:THUMP domain-containing protein [Porphyromonas sp.]
MHSKQYRLIAKTLHNLEDVLAGELEALGAQDIEIGRRAVSFVGDKRMLYKANLRLRTALRILKPVHTFRANNPDELYEALVSFPWDTIMRVEQSFAIDTTVFSDSFTHSKYVGYRAKDALVDYWRAKSGTRPNVSLTDPDIYLNIHIAHNEVTLSLDSSGESLHKRGYRDVQTDAPINEVLAAAILLKAGWDGSCDLIDPMCGSGTFLIEAALIARNIAPGIYRKSFAFEKWLDYDQALFEDLYNDDSEELEFEHKIYGSDILPHAIRVSDSNVRRAGVSRYIQLDILPFEERPKPERPALIVMNPPYGERLKLKSAEELYRMIGERLKHNYPGCRASIIAYLPEHFDSIGLKHSARTEVMNGSLECELRSYELFAGKREDFKRKPRPEGDTAERAERKPVRRTEGQGDKPFERKRRFEDKPRGERPERKRRFEDKPRGERPEGKRRFEDKPRGERPEGKRRFEDKPRGERPEGKRRFEDKPRGECPERKQAGPWPSDRFNYTDSEGKQRRRPQPKANIQVFRKED